MKLIIYIIAVFVLLCSLLACAAGPRGEALDDHISRLVDQTTKSERSARRALNQLESLGYQATPYLIGHLADVRPIAVRSIDFENKAPDGFELVIHYAPKTVHDALAAVLSQVTGVNFIRVYNGATLQERNENRDKWVEWCLLEFSTQESACRGK